MPTKEVRESRLTQKLCGCCGKRPHNLGITKCQKCIDYRRNYNQGKRSPRPKLGRNKTLQKKQQRESYLRNIDKARERRNKKRRYLICYALQYKKDSGGCPCGEKHPFLLDFHHRDPNNKLADISFLVRRLRSLKVLQAELEKCDILCANCHRRLHWNQNNPDDVDGFGRLKD